MKKVVMSISNYNLALFYVSKTIHFNFNNNDVEILIWFQLYKLVSGKYTYDDYTIHVISVNNIDTTKLKTENVEKYFNISDIDKTVEDFIKQQIDKLSNKNSFLTNIKNEISATFEVTYIQKLDEHLSVEHTFNVEVTDENEFFIDKDTYECSFVLNKRRLQDKEIDDVIHIHNNLYNTHYESSDYRFNLDEHRIFTNSILKDLVDMTNIATQTLI